MLHAQLAKNAFNVERYYLQMHDFIVHQPSVNAIMFLANT